MRPTEVLKGGGACLLSEVPLWATLLQGKSLATVARAIYLNRIGLCASCPEAVLSTSGPLSLAPLPRHEVPRGLRVVNAGAHNPRGQQMHGLGEGICCPLKGQELPRDSRNTCLRSACQPGSGYAKSILCNAFNLGCDPSIDTCNSRVQGYLTYEKNAPP